MVLGRGGGGARAITRYHVVFDTSTAMLYYLSYMLYYIYYLLLWSSVALLIYNTMSIVVRWEALLAALEAGQMGAAQFMSMVLDAWFVLLVAAYVARGAALVLARNYEKRFREKAESVKIVVERSIGEAISLRSLMSSIRATGSVENVLRAVNVYLHSINVNSVLRMYEDINTGERFVRMVSKAEAAVPAPAIGPAPAQPAGTQVFEPTEEGGAP